MAAQPPKLDERTLLQLVRQLLGEADQAFTATSPVPRWRYAGQFTEEQVRALLAQPLDDAGLMLAFIYARLLELALQRLNQAPEKNLLAFLDTMGVRLLPPSPARAPLTFALTAGSPPTFIPKGTQAGTQPSGQQVAVIFETEDDFTVIPAQLTAGFTMDPKWDRYTDQTPALGGQSAAGFTPLVGVKRMPHALYLGDGALLDFTRSTTVEARFNWAGGPPPQEIERFFQRLAYQYRTQGVVKTIAPTLVAASGGNQVRVQFSIAETIDAETIQGVGLPQGVASRWLRATLTTPFPDESVAQSLQLSSSRLRVSADDLLPDLAFNNAAPLDVTKDFFPFGETPKVGDAIYVGSREAFAKPGANVTLRAEIKSTPLPKFVWEYWDGDSWTALPLSSVEDQTNRFTQNGRISLLAPAPVPQGGPTGGVAAWSNLSLRVRVADGRYRNAPVVTQFKLVNETTLKAAASANGNTIQMDYPKFAAQGQVLLVEDEHVVVSGIVADNELRVTPAFRKAHAAGKSVTIKATVPITKLSQNAVAGATSFIVNGTGTISPADVLIIDDSGNPEFITVISVSPATDNTGAVIPGFSRVVVANSSPLRFSHNKDVSVARVTGFNFFGLADDDWQDFATTFHPFGANPSQGDVFSFYLFGGFFFSLLATTAATPGPTVAAPTAVVTGIGLNSTIGLTAGPIIGPPKGKIGVITNPFISGSIFIDPQLRFTSPQFRVNLDVKVDRLLPPVELRWEYLGANGWRHFDPTADGTNRFREEGARDIVLPPVAPVLAEVNGQPNYWVRARIVSGNYGLPVDFEPVDPAAPEKGFRVRAGTGNVNAPVLTKLTLGYNAERAPTVLTRNGFLHHNRTGQTFAPFVSVKQLAPPIHADVEPSFYLGFDAAFPEQPVSLYVAVEPRAFAGSVIKEMRAAAAASSALPPLRWEYFNGALWKELAVFDGTNNLTESGAVEFLTPADIATLAKFDLTPRYWIRARSPENDPFDTQQLTGVFLNTVSAAQGITVRSETLGSGGGEPNQTLRFARAPVLSGQQLLVREINPPSDKERAAIEAEEGEDAIEERRNAVTGETEIWVRWREVANFLRSDPYSRHYTLDHSAGLVTFGDGKRGMPPPRGTNNVAAAYRTGGGAAGNAPKAAIAQVKSPLPGVASVTNPVAADGGADAETLPMAQERGPQTLKHRSRAVACSDLEWLARQAAGTRVARAKCLPNVNRDLRFEPGWVTLLVVPQGVEGKLSPGSELIREVEDFLAERAFVGLARQTPARINVIGPGYIQVTVEAVVAPQDIDKAEQVKQRVRAALDAFLHPLTGGPDGAGWVFGRDVYESEVYRVIENTPGVSHVKTLRLIPSIAQRRFIFTSAPPAPAELPEGSVVMTTDRRKAALLAEPAPAGVAVGRVAIKGFKEGDRITKAQDLMAPALRPSESDPREIEVQPFNSDAAGFPSGSVVITFDGAQRTRLVEPIPRNVNVVSRIVVEDEDFVARLRPGDRLTVLYPFPITVVSVALGSVQIGGVQTPAQTLNIEPYEAEVAFPSGSVLATLDNRVRAPLAAGFEGGGAVTSIQTRDFSPGDALTLARRDGAAAPIEVVISSVQPAPEIVFLDDNFLVYPGKHNITMAPK